MKRSWFITVLVCLLLLGGAGIVVLLPRIVSFDKCSEVYKKYAEMEGMKATFIKDYQINDSVVVDVTHLKAVTDSAWAWLREDFNVNSIPEELYDDTTPHTIYFWAAPKNRYDQPMDTVLLNNDFIVVSCRDRTVAVFDIQSEIQIDAILYHQISLNKKH